MENIGVIKSLIAKHKSSLKSLSSIEKYINDKITPENFDLDELRVIHERLDEIYT